MPEIDLNKLSPAQRDTYSKWKVEQRDNGRLRLSPDIVMGLTGITPGLLDKEPFAEYVRCADAPDLGEHTLYCSESVARELERAGVIFEREKGPHRMMSSGSSESQSTQVFNAGKPQEYAPGANPTEW